MSSYDVTGKVCLVTGAGQGIGLATARRLYDRGATVALLDVNGEQVNRVVEGLDPSRSMAIAGDVRDRPAMTQAVADVIARFGALDVVVANAGVAPVPSSFRVMDPADYDRVVSINQTGVFNTVHPAIEAVIEAHGHIVVVASVAALMPGPLGAPYMMTKAAVEQFGRALRIELAPHGATVGIAYFGFVDTEMTRTTLDDDPLGKELGKQMPPFLNARISSDQAGKVIADGIARRAARTIAPSAWTVPFLLRGVLAFGLDAKAAGDSTIQAAVRDLERRVRG